MRAKHGIRVVALAIMAAVLGTMTLGVGGAQGQFLINLGAVLLATFSGTSESGNLLVPTRDLSFKCQEFHIEEGKINTGTDAKATITYLECTAHSLSTSEPIPCITTTLGTVTAAFLILPAGGFVLFEPQPEKTNFTTVSFKPGTECPLPLNNPVQGAITASVATLDAVVQLIVFSEKIQLSTGHIIRFGLNPAYIDRHAELELTGEHAGMKLGVH